MAPIFYVGYYPGKKPIKRKKSPPPQEIDNSIFDEFVGTFSFDENANVPERIRKIYENELDNLFKVRFTSQNNTVKTAQGRAERTEKEVGETGLGYEVTDETEYRELPGALGVSFDFKKAYEKGVGEALKSTGTGILDSVLTFKDLSAKAEQLEFWEPLLDEQNPKHKELSLSSRVYGSAYAHSRYAPPSIGPVRVPMVSGKDPSEPAHSVFQPVDALADNIRDFPIYGSSIRGVKYGGIKENSYKAFEAIIENNPEIQRVKAVPAADPELLNAYNRVHTRIEEIKKATKEKKDLEGQRDAGFSGAIPLAARGTKGFILDERLRKAKKREEELTDKFYEEMKRGGQLAKDLDKTSTYVDNSGREEKMGRRIMAWARVVDYREQVFKYNEWIDSVAEGNFFKNIVWGNWVTDKIFKGKLAYFTPSYYLGNLSQLIMGYAKFENDKGKWKFKGGLDKSGKINAWYFKAGKFGIPTPAGIINFFVGPVDKYVKKIENWLVNKKLVRFALVGWKGDIIKTAVTKAVQSIIVALGGTGVGTAPAVIAAVLTYVGEKVWDLTKAAILFEFDKAYEKFTKEIYNLVKFGLTLFMSIALPIMLLCMVVLMGLFGILAGTNVEPAGRGGVIRSAGNAPGGGGISCSDTFTGEEQMEFFVRTSLDVVKRTITGTFGTRDIFMPTRLTDCFGRCREGVYAHGGIDIGGDGSYNIGNEVLASPYYGDAKVFFAGDGGDFGNLIILSGKINASDPEDKYFMYFAHLSHIYAGVQPGVIVKKGQALGQFGSTGNSTGPHLHYEIRSGNQEAHFALNPCYVFPKGSQALLYGATPHLSSCPALSNADDIYPGRTYCSTNIYGDD